MCHVLVIEDEALVALLLEGLLTDCGATSFDFAETECEAVSAARARRPDLITSDVRLRDGSGPLAVVAILKECGPLPVIFVTATPEDCVPCDPPARVFSKPIREVAVADAVRELLAA